MLPMSFWRSLGSVGVLLVAQRGLAADNLAFRGNLSWINAFVHLAPEDANRLNSDNTLLRIPHYSFISDIRPNLKLSSSDFQIVARPKIVAEARQVKTAKREAAGGQSAADARTEDTKGKVKSTINEAFVNWTVSDVVTFAYGRQSYQWGAAESANPSNRMFHETAQNRNALYEIVGKDIARVNFTLGKSFSTVVMTEYQQNKDEADFVAEEEFAPTGLVKSEFSWSGGTDYAGLVVGGREKASGWVGEYFSMGVPFFDGLFFYADASHQRGGRSWYPVKSQASPFAEIIEMQQLKRDENKVQTFATAGLKFDFVSGTIIRTEYIHNDAGYSENQLKDFYESLDDSNPAQLAVYESNLERFSANGNEFTGKRYGYVSLHVPDLISVRDLTFYSRAMRSMTDESLNIYASFEYLLKNAGTVLFSGSANSGRKESELRTTVARSFLVGYRHNW